MKVETLPIHTITIPENRHRGEFDEKKIEELMDSILAVGNLHPPVLRNSEDTLLAGERRLRAISLISERGLSYFCAGVTVSPGHVAILRAKELSDIELREAELEENLRRVDLSWQERERAIADLHNLRTEQTNGKQTFRDTATELLGREPNRAEPTIMVRNAGIIAQHLDDPDVLKAKNSKEAMKIITKKAERKLRELLAEQYGSESVSEKHCLENIDAITGMKALDDALIDVVLSDPPYGIEAQNFGDQAEGDHLYDDSYETWIDLMKAFANESFRITKDQAHAYIFCDPRRFNELSEIFYQAGWNVWNTPIIWDKSNGMLPRPDHGPRRTYETILYAIKGEKTTTAVYNDVIRFAAESDRQHAAQKPVGLYVNLLRRSTMPGDKIIDPFAGSGTIFPAALEVNCFAFGFELDPASYAIALGRMEDD